MEKYLDVVIPFAVLAGLGLIIAMIRWPKVWLACVLFAMPTFFFDSGVGITATEVAMGVFLTLTVIIWTIFRINKPEPLIQWWPEFLILLFLVLSSFNIIVAIGNDVDPVDWLSEWSLYFLLLFYFPFRDVFGKSERDLRQLVILLAVVSVGIAAYSANEYRTRAADGMMYAYQLLSSRSRLGGPVFQLAILIGVPYVLISRSWWRRTAVLGVILINVAGLLQTFTRSLWLMVALGIVLMMPLLRVKDNVLLIVGTAAIAFISYNAAIAYNPKLTAIASKIMVKRVTTSTQLKGGDYSFETRLIEAEEAIRLIKKFPLGGNGLRAPFVSWDPIMLRHDTAAFMHIGYLSLMYKFGIPLTIIVFLFIGAFCVRALVVGWKNRTKSSGSPLVRSTALGLFAFVPTLLVTIFVAGFVDQRYGLVMMSSFFALTTICYKFTRRTTDETVSVSPT